MTRQIEILFVRHGHKRPQQPDGNEPLTEIGWEQGRELGKTLDPAVTTFFRSSKRDRARDMAIGISEGMGNRTKRVGQRIHFDFNKPPHAPAFGEEFESNYASKGGDAAFANWMQNQFNATKGTTPEEVGVRMILPLRAANRLSQGTGEPIRVVIVSHGGANLETAFYALTGVSPMVVGKGKERGTFKLAEPFRLLLNGNTMSVRFRNRKFTVQRTIKRVIQASRMEKKRIVEEVMREMAARRMRLAAQASATKVAMHPQRGSRRRSVRRRSR